MKSYKKIAAFLIAIVIACSLAPAAFAMGMVPVTGDHTNYGLVIGIVCVAIAVIVIALILGLRKKSGK